MYSGGWKSFWTALWTTLLVLTPLVGGTVLLGGYQARQRVRAAESQSGVPIAQPKAEDQMTLLVCVAGEKPGFVLVYLNADQTSSVLLALPGQQAGPFGEGEATLQTCYNSAGPARCLQALTQVLELPEGTRYLAIAPDTLSEICEPFGSLRVSFSGALTAQELETLGQSGAVQDWAPGPLHEFLTGLEENENIPPERQAAARAEVSDSIFLQKMEKLPAALPDALRSVSGNLLTDLTAGDYYILAETLEFLANQSAPVESSALPGLWEAESGYYTIDERSRAAVQAFFNVSPSAGQSASASAP